MAFEGFSIKHEICKLQDITPIHKLVLGLIQTYSSYSEENNFTWKNKTIAEKIHTSEENVKKIIKNLSEKKYITIHNKRLGNNDEWKCCRRIKCNIICDEKGIWYSRKVLDSVIEYNLNHQQMYIYGIIDTWSNNKLGKCGFYNNQWELYTGYSYKTVKKHLNVLLDKKLIFIYEDRNEFGNTSYVCINKKEKDLKLKLDLLFFIKV